MATNVLLPISPSGASSQGQGGQLTGKFIKSNSRNTPQSNSTSKGSITRKVAPHTRGSAITKGKEKAVTAPKEIDPQSYRNSVLHNICLDMLERSFHKSFSELFELVEQQRADHIRAGPAAILLEPLIENDQPKLEQLKIHLTQGEEAFRAGDMAAVYMSQQRLAQYFEQSKDTWLSDHFYHRCLQTGKMVEGDNRRKEGEAHCHVGLALENRGDCAKAATHMETFHQLARKHKWYTDSGDSLHEIACEHLRRIYTKIAEQVHSESTEDAITYLKKAHAVVKEGGDTYQEGLACYRLGNAYEGTGDHDTAIQYHRGYLERCKYHSDDTGVGCAYEALSKSHENKGDIENAVKYLEMYVEVSEKAGLQKSLAKACSAIGMMYNTLANYEKAVEFFDRCYNLCTELNDTEALHLARVHYGVAKSHLMMGKFSSFINEQSSHNVQQLVQWKDTRVEPSAQQTRPPSVQEIVDQSDNTDAQSATCKSLNSSSEQSV